jgi:hypothetical protein
MIPVEVPLIFLNVLMIWRDVLLIPLNVSVILLNVPLIPLNVSLIFLNAVIIILNVPVISLESCGLLQNFSRETGISIRETRMQPRGTRNGLCGTQNVLRGMENGLCGMRNGFRECGTAGHRFKQVSHVKVGGNPLETKERLRRLREFLLRHMEKPRHFVADRLRLVRFQTVKKLLRRLPVESPEKDGGLP